MGQEHQMEQKLGSGAEVGWRKAEKKREKNMSGSSPANKPLLVHAVHSTSSTELPLLLQMAAALLKCFQC